MLKFARLVPLGITVGLLGLAGCATDPARRRAGAPDWENLKARPADAMAGPAGEVPEMTRSKEMLRWTNGAPATSSKRVVPGLSPESEDRLEGFPETWVPLNRWARTNGLEPPLKTSNGPAAGFALKAPEGTLTFRAGSQVAMWQGIQVHLGLAPQLIDGQPYLHHLDVRKTLRALLFPREEFPADSSPVVVIDPGHGGTDTGTRGVLGYGHEKDFALDLARRLQAILMTKGWQAWLTRSNDVEMALSNRVAFAESRQANLFLSLHFNSAGTDQVERGLETYCLTPSGLGSTLTRGFTDDATLVFPNNSFDSENLRLAVRIHRELLEVNGHYDRGVRRARFPAVLRGQNCPAVLVEGGYLSNAAEVGLIATADYRQKMAEAIARALVKK
jgi:N-acetylmuramoyl-L-alanine amidase